ncbi:bifunctional 4-hydroxy-2-oxoglutarate aldolase/2-dehydro-3-deoxy-phosphogluconate aldolase [Micromonospora sp. NPDC005305]|uniref:bifunctional 4-hydroxy-2-oxoglutarate aldolase/2-dehydro-3-deoxy-phosphogluconate aldolase n=1 Tax=Micromonospora sp. NPDC005305 TaxID=3156875 RepID=UPI00339E5195
MTTLSDITTYRLIPVVVLHDSARADDLADALVAGGLPVAEVTLRTPAAVESIRAMAGRGDVAVGAGTVLTPEQVDLAVDAGASFIVCPGVRADVVTRAQDRGVAVVPGCVTASEVMAAQALGLSTVKFFPAAQYGGPDTIAALSAPFQGVDFIPTGGVSSENLADYLRLPSVPAVGGSWMVAPATQPDRDMTEVAGLCAAAVRAARAV